MTASLNLRCRWDQTFRFPRDWANYDALLIAGAIVRMVMTFENGAVLKFSSRAADGYPGSWEYSSVDKIGWFVCPLATLAAMFPTFYGSTKALRASWVCRIEAGAAAYVPMKGTAVWAPSGIAGPNDAASIGVDTFGATVFVDGEDQSGDPAPLDYAIASTAAQAALNSQNAAAASAAQAISASAAALAGSTAFRNRLINGSFDIWQRGASLTVPSMSAAWLADRWQMWNGGSGSINVSCVAAPAGFRGQYAMRLQTSGVAAGVNLPMWQGIEARQIADLDGKNVVVSFDMQASTSAGALTASVDIVHNSAVDNSSWSVGYTAIAFTVPAGAALVSVPIPAAAMVGAKNGSRLHIVFHQSGATGNQDIYLGAAQFEADRQIAGAWGNPTPFEFRPLSVELAMCQRYAQIIGSGAVGKVTTASTWEGSAQFKTPMRATPTLTLLTTTISAAETGVSARVSSGSTLSVYSVTATGANDLGLSGWSGLTAPNLMTIGTDCILASAEL